jgi:hypothetical protein
MEQAFQRLFLPVAVALMVVLGQVGQAVTHPMVVAALDLPGWETMVVLAVA